MLLVREGKSILFVILYGRRRWGDGAGGAHRAHVEPMEWMELMGREGEGGVSLGIRALEVKSNGSRSCVQRVALGSQNLPFHLV